MPPEEQETNKAPKGCLPNRPVRVVAALTGLFLAAAIVLALFLAGVFDSSPDLPDVMEGEATFTSNEGKEENFHVMIDYKKKIIQLASIDSSEMLDKASFGRRLMSYAENGTTNGTRINMTKIIIQDYNTNRKYFVIPKQNDNSTTKCIFTRLEEEMIPQHLLKYATLKSESVEGNTTHSLFQVDNDTDVDVYRAKGRNGKIYEVYMHLPNGTLHMRSREQEMNFTEFRKLNCYRYNEENDTIEKSFYKSNDSKFYEKPDDTELPSMNETVRNFILNVTKEANLTAISESDSPDSVAHRRRRGLGTRPNGDLDWWYGNWCGKEQGGYERYPKPACNSLCRQSTRYITSDCRNCLPPKDGFDAVCMEHDRCLIEAGKGPWWCFPVGNRCSCDFRYVWNVFYYILACPSWECRVNAAQAFTAFQLLSCWFPVKICFPWIRFSCGGCKVCCPRIQFYMHCFSFKMCAPFGSGKIPY
ncbi:uncharacterized protein LOC116287211 isoform X2 [Actinia tenebrosa]|uniref:Uncharacterized protein LOC116287211 isoform X2 n=1 Tax=Actinia tenebrosa TaxID=6105 RepID=A0A6P8H2Q8_ACTTE|nr:uncharacterized protein LOC116287211 isoform X2 [Actinia tenebrosa]XP_031549716.1 uncharacterized protein LOC116287211 isoform X2 [Actinia tenebrosa]